MDRRASRAGRLTDAEVYAVVDSLGEVGVALIDVKEERHSPLLAERHRELLGQVLDKWSRTSSTPTRVLEASATSLFAISARTGSGLATIG